MNIYQDIQKLRQIPWNGHSMKWAFNEMWFDEMSRSPMKYTSMKCTLGLNAGMAKVSDSRGV